MLKFQFLSRSQNERDGFRARKKCRSSGFSAGGHPPVVAAIARCLAMVVSFLCTRYFAYRTVQESFYGQALVPAKQAFDFHLVDQDGKPFQLSHMRGSAVC